MSRRTKPAPDALSYMVAAHVLDETPGLYWSAWSNRRQRQRVSIARDLRDEAMQRLRGLHAMGAFTWERRSWWRGAA